MLFVERSNAAADCPYSFSKEWLVAQHAEAVLEYCEDPLLCTNQLRENPAALMLCTKGQAQHNGTFFGLDISRFASLNPKP